MPTLFGTPIAPQKARKPEKIEIFAIDTISVKRKKIHEPNISSFNLLDYQVGKALALVYKHSMPFLVFEVSCIFEDSKKLSSFRLNNYEDIY